MYELKTKPTQTDPLQVITAIPNEKKQADALVLLSIFKKATGKPAVVWGEKYIGFGSYQYTYASGHSGEFYTCGFAVSKTKITLHLFMEDELLQTYLTKLGKVKTGKSCIYINKLSDIDLTILPEMIEKAATFVQEI